MKLSTWAKIHGFTYQTAWNLFKSGNLPVKAEQLQNGTIIVSEEKRQEKPSMTVEELEEIEHCTTSPVYFAENYCLKAKLYTHQYKLLLDLLVDNRVIVNTTRQAGLTTIWNIYALWVVLFHSEARVGVVSTNTRTSQMNHDMIKSMYETLPAFLKTDIYEISRDRIYFTNGSYVYVLNGSCIGVRGVSFDILIINDAAFIDDDFFQGIIPAICCSPKNVCIISSVPNGSDNFFHKIFTSENTAWKKTTINWRDVPGRDDLWKSDILSYVKEAAFAQEFDNQF